jgi:hypothetical protein
MALGFSAALLFASASVAAPTTLEMPMPITVISLENLKESRKRQRQMRREWMPVCRRVWGKRNDLDAVFADPKSASNSRQLADRFLYGDYGCRKDLSLALALMERIVSSNQFRFIEDHSFITSLIELHVQAKTAASDTRAQELKRLLWLRGAFYGNESELSWTPAEKVNFVARRDIWAYLHSQGPDAYWASTKIASALLSQNSPRYDPAAGISFVENLSKQRSVNEFVISAARLLIDGKNVSRDLMRAEALLWRIAPYEDTASAMILPLIAPRLNSQDSSQRDAAATSLMKLLPGQSFGRTSSASLNAVRTALVPYFNARLQSPDKLIVQDAMAKLTDFVEAKNAMAGPPLFVWLDRQLSGQNIEHKTVAWQSLARLSRAALPEALKLLEADIKRTKGIVDIGVVGEANNFNRSFITSDDYPPSALRSEEEGVVSVTLLVAPSGRGLQAFVTKGASPRLDAEVAKLAARRLRLKFPDHPGRYVRVRLPDIQFRLDRSCFNEPSTPAIGGAIVVEGECRITVIHHSPTI